MLISEQDVTEALMSHCGICQQAAGQGCINAATGEPLPDSTVHFYRLNPQANEKQRREAAHTVPHDVLLGGHEVAARKIPRRYGNA